MIGITLERGDGITRTIHGVRTKVEARSKNAQPYRGPYGTTWSATAGTAWSPPILRLSLEAASDERGITHAANMEARDFIQAIHEAALITTPAGVFEPQRILDVTRSPIASGQLVTVRISTRRDRAQDDTRVLRFINGRIWELR